MLSARRGSPGTPIILACTHPLIMTHDLARRIEQTHASVGRVRARHLPSVPGNPFGIESRWFGPIEATIVVRAVWYYGYFAGRAGDESCAEESLDGTLAWARASGQVFRLNVSPVTANAARMTTLLARGLRPDSFMTRTHTRTQATDRESASGVTVRKHREAFLDSRFITVPETDGQFVEVLQRGVRRDVLQRGGDRWRPGRACGYVRRGWRSLPRRGRYDHGIAGPGCSHGARLPPDQRRRVRRMRSDHRLCRAMIGQSGESGAGGYARFPRADQVGLRHPGGVSFVSPRSQAKQPGR